MMSGALKVFFDLAYYPCLDATRGRPFGLYVHGNNDTTGRRPRHRVDHHGPRLGEGHGHGLGHRRARRKADLEACWELGATVAATLMND